MASRRGKDVAKYRTPDRVRQAFGELGVSGLKTSSGLVTEEFLPELKGSQGLKVLTEMGENDPIVGAVEFSIVMLMRQAQWKVKPGVAADAEKEPTESAKTKATFVQSCMDDMSHTWNDLISEVMTMFRYGWAWHELVYKKRLGPLEKGGNASRYSDGLIGWKKIPLRAQTSLRKFEFDENGGVVAMIQNPPSGMAGNRPNEIRLPMEKSLLFRTQSNRNNPMGRSGLRNAYRPWYFKKRIEEIEGIGIERDLAGLPMLTTPEGLDIWNPDDVLARTYKQQAETLVRSIRRDEQEGVLKPFGWELELLSTGGTRQFDTTEIVSRYNNAIAMTALADFIVLGHNNRYGSKALAGNKTQMFQMAIVGWLDAIRDVFNRFAIPRLFLLNGWAIDEELCTLEHNGVDIPDLEALGMFLYRLRQAGFKMFPNIVLEKELLDTAGLPVEGVKLGQEAEPIQQSEGNNNPDPNASKSADDGGDGGSSDNAA